MRSGERFGIFARVFFGVISPLVDHLDKACLVIIDPIGMVPRKP